MSSLLDEYEKYHNARTDAEIHYGRIGFLQAIGSLLGNNCYNNLAPRIIHHNSYIAFIGPSSRSRKTTVQDLINDLLDWRDMKLPDNMSPEQFLQEVSEKPNCLWSYGEWSKLLKRMDSNHFLSDIVEYMNELFTCPSLYKKKIRGRQGDGELVEIRYPHICFSTTCTEEMLIKYTNDDAIEGGYFARFILAYGDSKSGIRKILTQEDRDHYGKMIKILRALDSTFIGNKVTFELTDEALKRHFEIEEEMYTHERIGSFAGRYSNYIVSFADILLICDVFGRYFDNPALLGDRDIHRLFGVTHKEPIIVEKSYIDRAWEILKPCFLYTDDLVRIVQCDKPVRLLTRYLEKEASRGNLMVNYSDAMNMTNLNKTQMKLAIDTMEQNGSLIKNEEISPTTRNREYKSIRIGLGKYGN